KASFLPQLQHRRQTPYDDDIFSGAKPFVRRDTIMSFESTRRTFLRLSVLGLATTATSKMVSGLNHETPSAVSGGKIEVWVSDPQLRCAKANDISWQQASGKSSETTILLNPGKKFQTILGFGAAFTDAACYMFNQL